MTMERTRAARIAALGALIAWGALHVVGGFAEIATVASDGGRAGLELLGSAAGPSEIPGEPGAVGEALIGFHGFLIGAAGLAVLLLAVTVSRTAWPRGFSTSLAIVVVADLGLFVFLLGPGLMRVSDGIWGPLLLVVALATALGAGWRPRQL